MQDLEAHVPGDATLPGLCTSHFTEVHRSGLSQREVIELEKGGVNPRPEDSGGESASARITEELAALESESFSLHAAALLLDVEPAVIESRLTSSPPTLIGIQRDSVWYVPKFQFDGGKLIPGLADVVALLRSTLHPVAVYRWFTTANPDLEEEDGRPMSPREWLCSGRSPAAVTALASGIDLI